MFKQIFTFFCSAWRFLKMIFLFSEKLNLQHTIHMRWEMDEMRESLWHFKQIITLLLSLLWWWYNCSNYDIIIHFTCNITNLTFNSFPSKIERKIDNKRIKNFWTLLNFMIFAFFSSRCKSLTSSYSTWF